eukprot:scaffold297742_cov36-Tisochrysis_lutea.AAC.1
MVLLAAIFYDNASEPTVTWAICLGAISCAIHLLLFLRGVHKLGPNMLKALALLLLLLWTPGTLVLTFKGPFISVANTSNGSSLKVRQVSRSHGHVWWLLELFARTQNGHGNIEGEGRDWAACPCTPIHADKIGRRERSHAVNRRQDACAQMGKRRKLTAYRELICRHTRLRALADSCIAPCECVVVRVRRAVIDGSRGA